jgi:hypothetical protein
MSEIINFVAVSGGFATFGLHADPATVVAAMQRSSPHPIELAAGWVMPTHNRVVLHDRVVKAFHRVRVRSNRGDWFEVPRDQAIDTMAGFAEELGGYPWRVRKRPLPAEPSDNLHYRAVVTPRGTFPTAAAAAAAYGISRQLAWDRAARRSPGWRFEDDTSPAPAARPRGRPAKEK